jgi:hypothetical protein
VDAGHFDLLTKSLFRSRARRHVLRGLAMLPRVGGLAWLVGDGASDAAKRRTRKHKARRKRKRQRRKPHGPCYPGTSCTPGPGTNNAGCDFENSMEFFAGDFAGANLHGANLAGAQLAKANLRDVDLGNACLVGANLLEADLAGTNLDGAILCGTLMPDGSIDDRDCGHGTRCCPTRCHDQVCPASCNGNGGLCSVIGFIVPKCCADLACVPSALLGPGVTFCRQHCTTDAECQARFGDLSRCGDPLMCPTMLGKCCTIPVPQE